MDCQKKKELYHSRLAPTLALSQAVNELGISCLVNASGISGYRSGDIQESSVDETEPLSGEGFLQIWCESGRQPRIIVRMLELFVCAPQWCYLTPKRVADYHACCLLLGPIRFPLIRIGHGQQALPWIHVADVVQIVIQALTTEHWDGPINLVSPQSCSQEQFNSILAQVTGRWVAPIAMPAFALRLALGDAAQLAISGQHAHSLRLEQWAYNWQYDQLDQALAACQPW